MMMGSLSFWFCQALALLTDVVLIGDSREIQCYDCDPGRKCAVRNCTDTFSVLGKPVACFSQYGEKDFVRKFCYESDTMKHILTGDDNCVDDIVGLEIERGYYTRRYYELKKYNPNDVLAAVKTEEEYVKILLKDLKEKEMYKNKYRLCVCSTDFCNDEEYDKLHMIKKQKKTSNSATTPLKYGNRVTVILFALAVLAYEYLGVAEMTLAF